MTNARVRESTKGKAQIALPQASTKARHVRVLPEGGVDKMYAGARSERTHGFGAG